MKLNDTVWTEKWSSNPFPRAMEGPINGGCGCEDDPSSSLWCASLAAAMGDRYGEGMKVLDYGCGYARFFNFLTGKLKDFTYYGLEVADSETEHGQRCIHFANSSFGADGRGRFGFIGSELEKEALSEVDVILLGSIFTHLDFGTFEKLFSKFIPVIERHGAVVLSIVLGEHYRCVGPGEYGIDDCYQETTYTRRQLLDYCDTMTLALTEAEHFSAPNEVQTIFRVERCPLSQRGAFDQACQSGPAETPDSS